MKQGPCLDCPDRTATCHGECGKYRLFKEERDAENAQRNKERRDYQEIYEYRQKKWRRLRGDG